MDMMWYRRRGLMVTPHIERATGAIASFNSVYNKIPVKSLICNIDPIQKGTGDPSPENVRPISGRTGVKLWRTGKNLLNANYYSVTTETETDRTIFIDRLVYLVAGVAYTFSCRQVANAGTVVRNILGVATATGGTPLAFESTNSGSAHIHQLTFTPSENGYYRPLYWAHTLQTAVTLDQFQVEKGSAFTSYDPYKGSTYSVNWETEAGTVYGGSLDVVSGKLTVDKRYVLLSNPDKWINYSGSTVNFAYTDFFNDRLIASDSFSNLICSYMPVVSGATQTARWLGATSLQFGLKNNTLTLEQIRSDATDGKISICYSLATPTEIQLTSQGIKTLLGMNNIWCDSGDVTVDYWKWGK